MWGIVAISFSLTLDCVDGLGFLRLEPVRSRCRIIRGGGGPGVVARFGFVLRGAPIRT